jgi:hypothetical protein
MPTTNAPPAHPCISSKLVFRPQGDQILVYNATTDQMYLLWPRAVEILKQCDGTRSVRQLAADALADEPRLTTEGEALVTRLLGQLEERRLITWQQARAKPDPAASPALAERR